MKFRILLGPDTAPIEVDSPSVEIHLGERYEITVFPDGGVQAVDIEKQRVKYMDVNKEEEE